jgi:hypothetical protein
MSYLERHQYKLFAQRVNIGSLRSHCSHHFVVFICNKLTCNARNESIALYIFFPFTSSLVFCIAHTNLQFYLIRLFFGPILCSIFISTLKACALNNVQTSIRWICFAMLLQQHRPEFLDPCLLDLSITVKPFLKCKNDVAGSLDTYLYS